MKVSPKPEFKLLPCVICTLGFNCYVAGHKVVSAVSKKITNKQAGEVPDRSTLKCKS